ncbi:uncharacterized protein PV09_05256 [Verruconis gallopava]|uniref:Uncharacterized protein n=1 Tax=Verruconis gallopava TaxID=253628 RepID=A0A0D2AWH2_9PEZI|nr:uncharacterized protein PV09_05256 [Verruconis gallopava]KIW03489.1 hypothetical protein PV09_05256 [Verruconis gallopava]
MGTEYDAHPFSKPPPSVWRRAFCECQRRSNPVQAWRHPSRLLFGQRELLRADLDGRRRDGRVGWWSMDRWTDASSPLPAELLLELAPSPNAGSAASISWLCQSHAVASGRNAPNGRRLTLPVGGLLAAHTHARTHARLLAWRTGSPSDCWTDPKPHILAWAGPSSTPSSVRRARVACSLPSSRTFPCSAPVIACLKDTSAM